MPVIDSWDSSGETTSSNGGNPWRAAINQSQMTSEWFPTQTSQGLSSSNPPLPQPLMAVSGSRQAGYSTPPTGSPAQQMQAQQTQGEGEAELRHSLQKAHLEIARLQAEVSHSQAATSQINTMMRERDEALLEQSKLKGEIKVWQGGVHNSPFT